MGPVEVIVYGGGNYYRDIFQSVALLAGTGGISSLIRLALVLGLILCIVKAVFDFNIGKILKWFLMAYITYGILFVPKVQVHVTDLFDPGLTGADVANVPLGVGMTASLTSRVGHRVIELTETAFGDPEAAQYSNTGMIYGAKVFERLRTARIADPRFEQNMHSFVRGCVYYDILEGHYSAGELARQNDIWNYVTVTRGTNPGRSVEYVNSANVRSIVTCPAAASALNAEWDATLTSSIKLFERRLRPDIAESQLQGAFQNELGSLHPYMLGAARDSKSAFQQVLMANAVRRGVTGFSAEAGGEAMAVMAETHAEVQTRNTQMLLGGVAEKAIVMLKIVVDLLFIGMFPILFPAFLLPGIGPRMVQGYLTGFLYLQLWGPMYVIIHKISMGTAAAKSAAAAYIPDTAPGLKIANLEALGTVNADIAAVAGVMTMMIPVLAGMLTKGAMAVGSQGEALLANYRSGAEAAGAAQTTGNYSFGNTAFENASWNNMSANRHATSSFIDTGNSTVVDGNLNTVSTGANGARTYTSSISQTAWNARFSDTASTAFVEAANNKREESQALRRSVSEAQSRVASEGVERVNSWLNSSSSTRTQGSEQRDAWGSTYQVMDQATQQLMASHGYNETTAKNAVARAAIEGFAEASGGLPGGGITGVNAKIGARATVGAEASMSKNAAESDQINAARTALSSVGFTDKVDKTTAEFASQTFSQTSTAQNMSAQRISDVFSSTRSITDTADQAETMSKSYDQRAEYARTNSASFDTNLNNQFTAYAMERLQGQRDQYGGAITEERAAYILSGRGSASETALVKDLEETFRQQEVMKLVAPEAVVEARSLGQTVQQMQAEPVRLIEPGGDGSALREGVSLGALGSPGQGISEHAPGTAAWREERAEAAAASASAAGARSTGTGQNSTQGVGLSAANDSGEPQLRPGFNSPYRESIRASTESAGNFIDAHRRADGKLLTGGEMESSQQEQGTARLGRRYPQ